MARKFSATASSLTDAMAQVLAQLAGEPKGDVDVELRAPGVDLENLGEASLHLEITEKTKVSSSGEDRGGRSEDRDATGDGSTEVSLDDLDEEAEVAADFVEGILDGMDLPGDLQIRVHEDHAEVEVVNTGSGRLIGRDGETLDAMQELLRCALQREFQRRARVIIDIDGYRERRLDKYLDDAESAIDDALDTGESQRLDPMDVYERKQIHNLVSEREGVASSSRGREPTRRVVIKKD